MPFCAVKSIVVLELIALASQPHHSSTHLPGIGEIAFHVVVMIVSLLVFAYAIGVVSAIEESANERALRFQAQQQYVRLVLKNHKLTPGLVSRVTAYLSYQFHNQNNFDASIMEGIPEGLQVCMLASAI